MTRVCAMTADSLVWAKSMIVYGAQLTADEENVLVDYLDEHFGKE